MKKTKPNQNSQLVYSTTSGRICPDCGQLATKCICKSKERQSLKNQPQGDGIVRIQREKKGRKGKTVTIISGILLENSALRELATELKRQCGTGGSIKDGVIIIQGDHCEKLMALLKKKDFTVKRAGG